MDIASVCARHGLTRDQFVKLPEWKQRQLQMMDMDDHLMLGITITGIEQFAERVFDELQYVRPSELDWVKGVLEEWHGGLQGYEFNVARNVHVDRRSGFPLVTGYDFVEAVRAWLKSTGNEAKSVLEVLRAEGSPHVGRANVFYSHVQVPDLSTTVDRMRDGCRDVGTGLAKPTFFWLDYLTLRQLRRDFTVPAILAVILSLIHI